MFERKKNGLIRKQAKIKVLEKKYKTGNKDIEVIIEEIKKAKNRKKQRSADTIKEFYNLGKIGYLLLTKRNFIMKLMENIEKLK